jgi:hypothetical protein
MALKTLGDLLSMLKGVKAGTGGRYTALCPAHEDKRQSLSVALDGNNILLKCHAGCDLKTILESLHLTEADLFLNKEPKKEKRASAPRGEIDKVYQYIDATGKLLYEVIRYKPKNFRQRRPDGAGGYIWDLKGVNPTIYHLPEVIEAVEKKQLIYLVEGEKDVESLRSWGLVASTNSGGAGKWKDEFSDYFIGAHVVVLPDNDPAGLKHAVAVCNSLYSKAASIRYFLPPVGPHEDITDWIEKQQGTREKLEALIITLPEWQPDASTRVLPDINCSDIHLREITKAALEALLAVNDPPFLFVRAGEIVRVGRDEHNLPIIEELNESAMRGVLERAANWIKTPAKGDSYPISPPLDVVRDLMALSGWPFPPLEGITETPTVRQDGSILTEPGYDSTTELYYVPAPGLTLPPVPENPTADDVKGAVELLEEIICDFPFDSPGSNANAIASMMTPVLRPLIRGPVPMTLFDKPQAGTGASLLADITSLIATGRTSAMLTAPAEDEDWRKSITSLLMLGRNVVTIDNIEGRLVSPSLAAVLTSTAWQDRVLGHSQMIILPHRVSWIGTGNNIRLAGDLPRRCFWVRMDAKEARPWQRTGFKHPKLVEWVTETRGAIIVAILTVARAWILAGKPQMPDLPVMGSFEAWVDILGNILGFAKLEGFLVNLNDMYDSADEETPQWEGFLSTWWNELSSKYYTVAELTGQFKSNKTLADSIPTDMADSVEDKGFTRKLGRALSKRSGIRYTNNLMIEKGRVEHSAILWAVKVWEKTTQNYPTTLFDQKEQGANLQVDTLFRDDKRNNQSSEGFIIGKVDNNSPKIESNKGVTELIPSPTYIEKKEENIRIRGGREKTTDTPITPLSENDVQKEIRTKMYEVSQRLDMTVEHAVNLWEGAGSPHIKIGERIIEDLGETLMFEELTDSETAKVKKWLGMQEV